MKLWAAPKYVCGGPGGATVSGCSVSDAVPVIGFMAMTPNVQRLSDAEAALVGGTAGHGVR
jgi:hypothetical protein